MRRVVLKSPVLENCTPGSVRGAPGNRRLYLAIMTKQNPQPQYQAVLPFEAVPPPHDSVPP